MSWTSLGGADQEGEAASGSDECGRSGERGFEALDGAEGDYVEAIAREVFGALILYIDVRQSKGARDFAEEGGLLMVGLDQGEREVRSPELDGKAGESGAGTYVGDRFKGFYHRGHRGRLGEEVASGEEALAEVAGDDGFGFADGGQVDAGIPAKEYIDIRRYILHLCGGQDSGSLSGFRRFGRTGLCFCVTRISGDRDRPAEKGDQQVGDTGDVHGSRFQIVDGRLQIWGERIRVECCRA